LKVSTKFVRPLGPKKAMIGWIFIPNFSTFFNTTYIFKRGIQSLLAYGPKKL
jgi:hypothetical protein